MRCTSSIAAVAAILVLQAAPALAEPAGGNDVISKMVGDLADESRFKRLNGALAACLAGRGDRYLTVSRFEDHGWTPHVEEDMGIIEMRRPDVPELYVWVADDDGSCRVWSEDVGTQDAFDILNELAEAAGFVTEKAKGEIGCAAITIAAGDVGYLVEVTSPEDDPVCVDVNASAVHFIRADG